MKSNFLKILIIFIAILFVTPVQGQETPKQKQLTKVEVMNMSYKQLLELPFEELINLANIVGVSTDELLQMILNKEVSTASKKKEKLFDSPLSTSVITAEEIKLSGATTIEDALRLAPGMIVREKTNGTFDVHVRGFDNVPPDNFSHFSENMISLVMIDNIPVYNNVSGGTFWETLPVSMNQIERIDIVRGPSSALYGPNAASGVINIITRQAGDKKVNVYADQRIGNFNTYIGDIFVSSKINDKLSITAGGKYDMRDRFTDKYYSYLMNDYIAIPPSGFIDMTTINTYEGILYQSLNADEGKKVFNGNLNLAYKLKDDIRFNVSGGFQDSKIQTIFFENLATPFSCRTSSTGFFNFQGNVKNFSAYVAYQGGKQDLSENMTMPVIKYDMSNLNANLEYNFLIKKLSLRPGVNYQNATYNDSKYEKEMQQKFTDPGVNGLFHGKKSTSLFGGSLRADYEATDKLRLIAAVRADQYKYINDMNLSYQFVASYKLNENHIIRALYSRANRGAFVGDLHSNFKNTLFADKTMAVIPEKDYNDFKAYLSSDPTTAPLVGLMPATVPVNATYNQYYIGTDVSKNNFKLLTIDHFEVGWRGKISSNLQLDIEAFTSLAKNFDALVSHMNIDTSYYSITDLTGVPNIPSLTPLPKHLQMEDSMFFENLPVEATQYGISATINYSLNNKVQFKLFGTIQQTELKNHIALDGKKNDIYHKNTPSFYGGFNATILASDKLNFFVGSYFYGEQSYSRYWTSPLLAKDDKIKAKMILNLRASYKFWQEHTVYVETKNLLFDDNREFAFADPIKFRLLGGISLKF